MPLNFLVVYKPVSVQVTGLLLFTTNVIFYFSIVIFPNFSNGGNLDNAKGAYGAVVCSTISL